MTGASNFLGTKPPLDRVRQIATASGYPRRARRGDQRVAGPGRRRPARPDQPHRRGRLDVDYLAFSFHKVLAPFGVGILYAREALLERSLPFLYGGDMIAEGQVTLGHVEYNQLPWKYVAGTPNVLGVIASAQALRLLVDLALDPPHPGSATPNPSPAPHVETAMALVQHHVRGLTDHALDRAHRSPGYTIYGPPPGHPRSPLMAFNVHGLDPRAVADALDNRGIEARAGCHCATLAHLDLGLTRPAADSASPPTPAEHDVDRALDALERVVR